MSWKSSTTQMTSVPRTGMQCDCWFTTMGPSSRSNSHFLWTSVVRYTQIVLLIWGRWVDITTCLQWHQSRETGHAVNPHTHKSRYSNPKSNCEASPEMKDNYHIILEKTLEKVHRRDEEFKAKIWCRVQDQLDLWRFCRLFDPRYVHKTELKTLKDDLMMTISELVTFHGYLRDALPLYKRLARHTYKIYPHAVVLDCQAGCATRLVRMCAICIPVATFICSSSGESIRHSAN